MSTTPTDQSLSLVRGDLIEVQKNHISVSINEVATRIDDRDIEGVWLPRKDNLKRMVFLERQDEYGRLVTIQVHWSAGTRKQAERYCERVGECAAINAMNQYLDTGFVERNGYRLNDTSLLLLRNKEIAVDWKEVSGIEIVGDDLEIWTKANEVSTLTCPSDEPNSLVLKKLIPAIASQLGINPDCKQYVGEFECRLIHPMHVSIYFAFGFGVFGTGLLRQVPNDYSILYTVFGMYACGLAMLYAFTRMANRAATAIIFRDHLALLARGKRVEIPWSMLDKLLILNCPTAGKKAKPSRSINSCSKSIPILRDPRYLFVQPNTHEQKLLDWIRQRVKCERDIKICERK